MARILDSRNMNREPYSIEREERCLSCYYATHKQFNQDGGVSSLSCNYCMLEGVTRGEYPHECTHYKEGVADYDIYKSCSLCQFYEMVDVFDGYCRRYDKEVKHYRPSCKSFKMYRQRVCGNCVHNITKSRGYYCIINKKYVDATNLCPDHKFIKKGKRNG